ncbi:MAG: NAD-binding oxidoreductase [Deltaproteobacteria bacterium]|nr:NAD-binding oxidoreductase [Deltaproteobacteria bacterium]
MSDVEFTTVEVLERQDRGTSGWGLKLDAAAAGLTGTYQRPGQYLRVRCPGGEAVAYLALASAPTDGSPWELLLQPGGGAVDEILAHLGGGGSAVEVSGAEGAGFGLAEQAGRPLLLVAGGSGISALRSVLREVLAAPAAFGPVTLLHGVSGPAALAYPEEHEGWRAAGIRLLVVVSREAPGWEGARGHVQDHLAGLDLDPGASSAFLCGPRAMQDDLRRLLLASGFEADRVRTNY